MTQFFKFGAFQRIFPRASKIVTSDLDMHMNGWLTKAGCPSKTNANIFVSQVIEESAGLTVLEENLRYSAKRLTQVWPKRFPTLTSAKPYAFNSQKLANKVYANRMGNKGEASGDGWKYRGKNGLQITGHDNHVLAAVELGLSKDTFTKDPEQLLKPIMVGPGLIAVYRMLKLHRYEDVKSMTKAINGGYTNLAARTQYYRQVRGINTLMDPVLLEDVGFTEDERQDAAFEARDVAAMYHSMRDEAVSFYADMISSELA